ncbi:MAG TPA: tetratricopeptide repeat protein [Vicingaceae bacterium]
MFHWKNILLWLFFILLFTSNNGKAQTTLDTLIQNINSNISVDKKLNTIKNASNSLILSNPDTLIYYCNIALKLCDSLKNEEKKLFFLGVLSEVHFNLSNYSEALKYTFQGIKICEENGDSLELANLLNNVGRVYNRVNNKADDAKNYFIKSLEIRKRLNDSIGMASSYNNIGIIYMMKAEYDTGMTYWENSLKIKLAIGDSIGASTTMNNMAMYYRDIGETKKALEFFNDVLRIKKRINDHAAISMAYQNLGELYFKLGETEKGIDYYLKSLEEAKLSKSKQLISFIHNVLATTYYKNKDYKLAYDNFLKHSLLEDSIFSEKTIQNLDELESKYQNEKKALLIENLEKEKKVQLEKQNIIILSSGLGLLSMLIIVIIVSKNYRQKKKDHAIIFEQKNILSEKNKEITDSITYARRLQEAILPPNELIKEKLPDSFILFKPKDVVSGDFYWLEHKNSTVFFAVADCTGHGVPGAMVSVVCSNALNRAVKEFELINPAKILDKVRELVIETFEKSIEDVKDGMDIALCSFNTKTNELHYAGANNPLWIIRQNNKKIEEIKANKQPIGIFHDFVPFTNHQIQLTKGDQIYLFSDGYPDQFGGEKGKKMMYKPFKNILIENSDLEMSQQKEILAQEFEKWKGKMDQIDDVCIFGIKV